MAETCIRVILIPCFAKAAMISARHGARMVLQIVTHGLGLVDSGFLRHFAISVSGLRLDAQLLPPESPEQATRQRQRPRSVTRILDMPEKRAGGAVSGDLAAVPDEQMEDEMVEAGPRRYPCGECPVLAGIGPPPRQAGLPFRVWHVAAKFLYLADDVVPASARTTPRRRCVPPGYRSRRPMSLASATASTTPASRWGRWRCSAASHDASRRRHRPGKRGRRPA